MNARVMAVLLVAAGTLAVGVDSVWAQAKVAVTRASRDAAAARRRAKSTDEPAPIWKTIRSSGWLLARTLVTWFLFDGVVLLMRELTSSTELALYTVAARPVGLSCSRHARQTG